jgi:two-component system chemotaxis response regulator CheB
MPPIAIVQHISPHFSRAVAERLDALSSLDVREAGQGDVLEPGTCVLAPGDAHLALEFSSGAYRTKLLKTPPIHHCRPAVDVLFRSAAEAGGDQVVAALLTGMGSDGAIGMGAIRAAGGATIAEHESTCVVYGMPRAAIEAGAAERVLPLPAIADAIIDAVSHRARRS